MRVAAILLILAAMCATGAVAQTPGNFQSGQVLTASELNTALGYKQDYPAPAPPTILQSCAGAAANSVLAIDSFGQNCVAAPGLSSTPSGVNMASGYSWLYNGVQLAWAQTALSSVFIGPSGSLASSGQFNTAMGFFSFISNQAGADNTAIGYTSLRLNTSGADNTAAGFAALFSNTTANYNSAFGSMALYALSINSVGNNTAIGYGSIQNGQTLGNNTAVGYNSGTQIGAIVSATAMIVGNSYTIQVINSSDFTLCGAASNTVGLAFTPAMPCTGTGQVTGNSNNNLLLGYQAATALQDGNGNTVIGGDPGGRAYNNVLAVFAGGIRRLHNWGTQNIFLGGNGGNFTLTGSSNVCAGYQCLTSLTTGSGNAIFGASAGDAITTSANNSALGNSALGALTTGAGGNVAVGSLAGQNLTTGANNVCVGANSCGGVTTGANDVVIGGVTGLAAALSNAIIIGDGLGNVQADYGYTTAARWTLSAGLASPQRIVVGASPTTAAGTCVPSAMTGGNTAGTFTIPAGNCAAATNVVLTFGVNAPTGWECRSNNITAAARNTFLQSATALGTATLTTSAQVNAGDVIQFGCTGY
jgi:hypothetical protein